MSGLFSICCVFFFFSSRRRHTRCREVSWARRCVQETGRTCSTFLLVVASLHSFQHHEYSANFGTRKLQQNADWKNWSELRRSVRPSRSDITSKNTSLFKKKKKKKKKKNKQQKKTSQNQITHTNNKAN
eukprot:TRINITY_DN10186_c0_g1_i2.p2 TRINITY_DN10186_c0_g1~~TRINITY_DN10186_c0_g1_i2.p2  ORF type:complete len:129 (-),score=42.43 TRINITY_DN10186_c0_g1_i2:85-471(-)